jgi:hypothetical protein
VPEIAQLVAWIDKPAGSAGLTVHPVVTPPTFVGTPVDADEFMLKV